MLFKKAKKEINPYSEEKEKEIMATKDRNKIMQFCWDRDLYNMKQREYEEYKILVAIDNRTCDKCKEMNDKIFKVDDAISGVNYPPFCEHCRCTTIPVLDESLFK